jgi:hypothetical protein
VKIGLEVTATDKDTREQIYHKEFGDSALAGACRHAAQVQKQFPAAKVEVTWGTGKGVYWPEVEDRRRNPEKYRYSEPLRRYGY